MVLENGMVCIIWVWFPHKRGRREYCASGCRGWMFASRDISWKFASIFETENGGRLHRLLGLA